MTQPVRPEIIPYPPEDSSKESRKEFKDIFLKERPERLFADYRKLKVCNLIFYTPVQSAWESAICSHYQSDEREELPNGRQLQLKDKEGPDTVTIKVNIYTNGTVMVQGDLRQFEEDFQTIKDEVHQAPSSSPTSEAPERENDPPSPDQGQMQNTMTPHKEKYTQLEIELKSAQQERDHLKDELADLKENVSELQSERRRERERE